MFRNVRSTCVGVVVMLVAAQLYAAGKIEGKVTCGDLRWSAEVLEVNPDIATACRGVYEKDGELYAMASIEVVRVRGSTLTFRTILADGSKGPNRRVTLAANWRARIADREYRIGDLMRGQQLNIYLPEDRFVLMMADEDEPIEYETSGME